ncbi:hypothetical protein G6F50_015255 [Rhizopus delemar]|uniref:Uncharacterized protein n=1 Tax=Rhizopus delemar TaxID=936053 RepID=A0A9P7C474_9FUNG|nr:hypothetical protein G6F50_015255 [Rhizopus delemar]
MLTNLRSFSRGNSASDCALKSPTTPTTKGSSFCSMASPFSTSYAPYKGSCLSVKRAPHGAAHAEANHLVSRSPHGFGARLGCWAGGVGTLGADGWAAGGAAGTVAGAALDDAACDAGAAPPASCAAPTGVAGSTLRGWRGRGGGGRRPSGNNTSCPKVSRSDAASATASARALPASSASARTNSLPPKPPPM